MGNWLLTVIVNCQLSIVIYKEYKYLINKE